MNMKFDFLRPRERFLILEILPHGTNGLFVSVDEDRNLLFEKLIRGTQLKKILKAPSQRVSQKSWEGQHLFKSHRKVIVVADPSIATTIPVPLDLRREGDDREGCITLAELENLIAQAMAKIFNQCRTEASHRLCIDELDTIMVGARVERVKVDGRPVENPMGRSGSKISLLLELTFTNRSSFEELKQLFNAPEEFFFAESPQVRLAALSRVRPLPMNLIVASGADTSLFVLEKARDDHPVLYRERLDWDFNSLVQSIANALGTTKKASRELYDAYLEEKTSESVARHLRKMIDPALARFLASVDHAKIKGCVYVDASVDLPFKLPYRHGGATFESMPVNEVMSALGFTSDLAQWKISPNIASRYLAPFFEAYFDKHYSEINKKLRRRLHWLAE